MEPSSVEDKLRHLEQCYETLRAELDFKMGVIEQILTTRNEQFVAQKKLIEKEHALFENVLTRWRNTGGQRADTRYLHRRYDVNPTLGVGVDLNNQQTQNSSLSTSTPSVKRSLSEVDLNLSLALEQRTFAKAKRLRSHPPDSNHSVNVTATESDTGWEFDKETDGALDCTDQLETEGDSNSGGESDDEEVSCGTPATGMEKRVFVNFYTTDSSCTRDDGSSDPIWMHFLHEEKGPAALCKHCDNLGIQKLYQLKTPGLAVLRTHLKRKHKIIVEAPPTPEAESDSCDKSKPGGPQRKNYFRHDDHLYTRYKSRGTTEYWRCRDCDTCAGRVIKRRGIPEVTGEHTCLTTPADCDAAEFREKLKDLAEAHPTLSASDIIAAAKNGYTQEVLDLVPKDDSLRRTIRRIKQTMESAATMGSVDWTSTTTSFPI